MALITPEFLATQKYEAKKFRRALAVSGIAQEGIVNKGDFLVSQRAAGVNRSVDVAAGDAWVKGDSSTDQGYYHVANNAAVNVSLAANSSGNPRIDLICLLVNDSADGGAGSDTPELTVVQGTAKSGATLANLKGAPGQTEGPSVGNTRLPLAFVLVANGATEIKNEHIGYLCSPLAGTTGYPAQTEPKARAGAPPPYAYGRPAAYVPSVSAQSTGSLEILSGSTGAGLALAGTELWDNDEMHSTSVNTSRLICNTPGLYNVVGQAGFTELFATNVFIYIRINGTTDLWGQAWALGTNHSSVQINGHVPLGYGDYLEIKLTQESGSTRKFTGKGAMHWVSPF